MLHYLLEVGYGFKRAALLDIHVYTFFFPTCTHYMHRFACMHAAICMKECILVWIIIIIIMVFIKHPMLVVPFLKRCTYIETWDIK